MCKAIRLTAMVGLSGTAIFAADYTWDGAPGSFQTDTHWSPVGVPGAADNAKFTTAGTYGVTFSGNATNVSTMIGADVTFGLGGYSWLLSGGLTFSGTSIARFGGGSLTVGSPVTVANNQKLVLNSGTSIFTNMLTESGGAIEVNGGDHAWQGFSCSTPPAGGASFRMTNGTVSVSGDFISSSAGAVYSLEGGTLLIPPGGRGFQLQKSYTFNVYTNAMIDYRATSRMYLSYTSSGNNLNIIGGTFTNTGINLVLGSPQANSRATVHLVDGLFYSSKPVYAGGVSFFPGSTKVTDVLQQSGGHLQLDDTFYLGSQTNSMGVYTQSGGTAWCKNIRMGCYGTNATGKLTLTGGTLATPNTLYVGYVWLTVPELHFWRAVN